jgi:hypothetical protein
MSDRISAMREQGVFVCPTWCIRPDDEHLIEEHVSDLRALRTSWDDVIALRLRLPWSEEDSGGHLEMIQQKCPGNTRVGVRFDADDRHAIEDLIFYALDDLESFDEQWAYDGAEDDEAEYDDEAGEE